MNNNRITDPLIVEPFKPKTKSQKKIFNILNKYGIKVFQMRWEPLGKQLEMGGLDGGWSVETDEGWFGGYNVQQVLDDIDWSAEQYGWESN